MSPESVFDVNQNQADCSIFAPQAGYGADTYVSFMRSTLRMNPLLSQPRLNSAGETGLSFAPVGAYLGSLQPAATNVVRLIQGILVQVNFKMFLIGSADIQELDRCTIEGRRLEVINAQHWGSETTEIDLRFLGR